MRRLIKVIVTFQRFARPRERKDVVGFREAEVRFKNRVHELDVNIPVGPGENGTNKLKHIIARMVMKYRRKGDVYYYVKVEEEREKRDRKTRKIATFSVFRTVMPRLELPEVSIRHI